MTHIFRPVGVWARENADGVTTLAAIAKRFVELCVHGITRPDAIKLLRLTAPFCDSIVKVSTCGAIRFDNTFDLANKTQESSSSNDGQSGKHG